MRFTVSDTLPGNNSFGKWRYSYDNDFNELKIDSKIILWSGYTIEQDLQAIVNDKSKLQSANGKFCVIILTAQGMEVCLDYFAQTKVYYHTSDGFTLTNDLSALGLKPTDVNLSTIDYFMKGLGEDVPMYACKDPMNMRWIYEWNNFSHDNTIFKNLQSIPRDYWLVHHDGNTQLKKVHDTHSDNFAAFGTRSKISDEELQDRIHQCMEQHSEIIKKNYSNICSSISEGIDSTLQDQYFDADTRLMYHPQDSSTSEELPPKHDLIAQYQNRGKTICFDKFDVGSIDEITIDHVRDPMLSWVDTVPTIWQINKLPAKPGVVLYGTYADEMFMHVPKFLFARVPPNHRHKYVESYGGRKSPARPFQDPYRGEHVTDWHSKFAELALPSRYGRDVEIQTGVLTASLYADRRIYNLIHSASVQQQIDSMAHVGTQRRILQDKFNFEFKTKYKDGAGYECRMVIKQLLTKVKNKVLGDR